MKINKKIAVWCLLCALMVALVPTCSTKAEEVTTYTDLNDWLGKSGRNFPDFDLKEGASYLFVFANHGNEDDLPGGYYVLEVLNDTKTNYFYGELYMSSKKAVNYYYLGYSLLSDYSNFSWTIKKSVESTSSFNLRRYGDSYINIHYTDRIIYEDSNYRAVSNYSNKPLKEVPSVPSVIKKQAESYIVGRMSPLRKAYAQEPFILVSSGQPFLRASDRCIGFLDSDMSYVADVELWLVDENGEWYLSNTSLNAHCGSDVNNVALEYAPEVIYTNKTIYLQDETSAEMALSSEVYASLNTGDSDAKEVFTSGFPRLFEVSDTLAYLYSEPTASSTLLYALYNGKGGVAKSVAYDDSGTAWYEVSVMCDGTEQVGYVKYDLVVIGASLPSVGGSDSEVTPVPTTIPDDSSNVDLGVDLGDITLDEIPEVIKNIKDSIKEFFGLVGVVPLMIGAVFGFLPDWCLWVLGVSFAFVGILLVYKLIRG